MEELAVGQRTLATQAERTRKEKGGGGERERDRVIEAVKKRERDRERELTGACLCAYYPPAGMRREGEQGVAGYAFT